jgi:peptidoglycan/LPS O-acetylase OafA/YrhL
MISQRSAGLDGIRGWAAFSVAIFHCILRGGDASMITNVLFPPILSVHGAEAVTQKVLLSLFNGHAAVTFFFLLSGCVLIQSLQRMRGSSVDVAAQFAVKRALRIYPATICAVLFVAGLFFVLSSMWPDIFPYFNATSVIENTTLYLPIVIGGTWTLRVEILFIPYFTVVGLAANRVGVWAVAAAIILGFAVYHWPTLINDGWVREAAIPMSLGMIIPSEIGRRTASIANPAWPLVLFLALASRHIAGYPSESGMYAHCVFAFLFVAIVYHCAPATLDRFLTSGTSQWLGRLSFSFYLFAYPLLMVFTALQPTVLKWPPLVFAAIVTLPVLACGLLLATISERYVERTSIRAGKRAAQNVSDKLAKWRNKSEPVGVRLKRRADAARR